MTDKIKVYGFYTEDHRVLKEQFMNSLQDDWECHLTKLDLQGSSDFRSKCFLEVMQMKLPFILNTVKENLGSTIIYSDLDIQFFNSCDKIIKELISDVDLLFVPEGEGVNTGFIIIKCNDQTEGFFMYACEQDVSKHHLSDQGIINDLLNESAVIMLNYRYLPASFWLPTHSEKPPKDILFHHAVDTVATKDKSSLQLKLEQLKWVKECVNK